MPVTAPPMPVTAPPMTATPTPVTDASGRRAAVALRVGSIVAAVAKATGIPADEIAGRSRSGRYSRARQAVCRIAVASGRSLAEIGRRLGDRDHTTVLSHQRKGNALAGEAADELARIEEAARRLIGCRDFLELLPAYQAQLIASKLAAEIPRPPVQLAPPTPPKPPTADELIARIVAASRPRAGFINRAGEIVVGAPREERR